MPGQDGRRKGNGRRLSLRRRWGRWLERRDRCCVCRRRIGHAGTGTHTFGFWFCSRHFDADTIERWGGV